MFFRKKIVILIKKFHGFEENFGEFVINFHDFEEKFKLFYEWGINNKNYIQILKKI